MRKSDIAKLIRARSGALQNAALLLDGGDQYPTLSDIGLAESFLHAVEMIEKMLKEADADEK